MKTKYIVFFFLFFPKKYFVQIKTKNHKKHTKMAGVKREIIDITDDDKESRVANESKRITTHGKWFFFISRSPSLILFFFLCGCNKSEITRSS
jgi:hypothetical protein